MLKNTEKTYEFVVPRNMNIKKLLGTVTVEAVPSDERTMTLYVKMPVLATGTQLHEKRIKALNDWFYRIFGAPQSDNLESYVRNYE